MHETDLVAYPQDDQKMEAPFQAKHARGDRQVLPNGDENPQRKACSAVEMIPGLSTLTLLTQAHRSPAPAPATPTSWARGLRPSPMSPFWPEGWGKPLSSSEVLPPQETRAKLLEIAGRHRGFPLE